MSRAQRRSLEDKMAYVDAFVKRKKVRVHEIKTVELQLGILLRFSFACLICITGSELLFIWQFDLSMVRKQDDNCLMYMSSRSSSTILRRDTMQKLPCKNVLKTPKTGPPLNTDGNFLTQPVSCLEYQSFHVVLCYPWYFLFCNKLVLSVHTFLFLFWSLLTS